MSESEDDLFNTNVLNYRKENTTFSVRGPNINISSTNIKNSMHNPGMPANFKRPRYAESCIDQRNNRDISPVSMRSAFELPRNYYHNSLNYQRPMFNSKAGSPMSVRSIESISSTSATEIALAFRKAEIALTYKNAEFNSNDLKLIKDAYHKFMKKSMRGKITKKRHFKTFERHCSNNSQDLSGDLTNISSSSSSDDNSPKKNKNALSCRSTKSGLTSAKSIMTNNKMSKENPENTQTMTFGNISSIPPVNAQETHKLQNISVMPKDRFKKGYDLPIQRFNHSTIQESNENLVHKNSTEQNENAEFINTNDNEQEVVSNSLSNKIVSGLKRNHDKDMKLPQKKKRKTSPLSKSTNLSTAKDNDFAFPKPKFPVRKTTHIKKVGEGLISSTLLNSNTLNIENSPKANMEDSVKNIEANVKLKENEVSDIDKNVSDVSGRPSFIRRKLFTQKLEVTEKRNLSTDNIQSPQAGHTVWQKDKTKPRKLTTAQLCLTRDIDNEESNLYDLISKIVPTEQINQQDTLIQKSNMNAKNKKTTKTNNSKSTKKKLNNCAEDWDVISVISTCNQDSISETYTDDEVFEQYKSNATDQGKSKKQQSEKPTTKNTVADNKLTKQVVLPQKSEKLAQTNAVKKTPLLTFKSFWDTDLDTDIESMTPRKTFSNNKKTESSQKESTTYKINSIGNGLKSIQHKDIRILLQKTDKQSTTDLHKNHSFNLRDRVKRSVTNSCCNETHTPNLQRNQTIARSYTKNNSTQKNNENSSKNKGKQNNINKVINLDDSPKNYNDKIAKNNKMTTYFSLSESKSKNVATLNSKQKSNVVSKRTTKTGLINKGSDPKRILLTPRKNQLRVHDNSLNCSSMSDGLNMSKCLRSRVVNLSNDSLNNTCIRKLK